MSENPGDHFTCRCGKPRVAEPSWSPESIGDTLLRVERERLHFKFKEVWKDEFERLEMVNLMNQVAYWLANNP